ncbi:MAG: threonine synthase [Bacteroidota bacterium]|nr:threonine synthase [Bacteroidota bacterium]
MKFQYVCNDCGKVYETNEIMYLCNDCAKENKVNQPPKGVLKVEYNYGKITKDFSELEKNAYLDLLPIRDLYSLPNLRIGNTPVYEYGFQHEGANITLFIKDDSQNATFSFKDRASALVSAFAKEKEIDTIVAASTGNAGSSLAGICAAQQQKAIIYVPKSAPQAKLTQIKMYGAKLVEVDGNYDKAFDLSIEATKKNGWYNRNTAFNPLTIEGKKTVAFEIFSQLNQQLPDRIFVPVGDGVIISGVYKGFEDLLKIGIIDKMPIIVAVQASGSNNLISNIDNDEFVVKESNTIADSISVDIPRNFFMARDYIKKYNGEVLEIADNDILKASKILSETTGLFAEPAAASAFAGFMTYFYQDLFDNESQNMVLLTGSGLKDLSAVQDMLKNPEDYGL